MLKTTDDYSRIWLFTYMGISLTLFLLSKVLFDFIYAKLDKLKCNTKKYSFNWRY